MSTRLQAAAQYDYLYSSPKHYQAGASFPNYSAPHHDLPIFARHYLQIVWNNLGLPLLGKEWYPLSDFRAKEPEDLGPKWLLLPGIG
jgi:hypothetical protein